MLMMCIMSMVSYGIILNRSKGGRKGQMPWGDNLSRGPKYFNVELIKIYIKNSMTFFLPFAHQIILVIIRKEWQFIKGPNKANVSSHINIVAKNHP